MQYVFTIAKVLALILIILIGCIQLGRGVLMFLLVVGINVKNKVYKKKTVIGDVVAHLKLQKFTVSSDL